MTAGRPTDYRPEYCKQIIEQGKLGKSVVQMANHFDVVKQTLFDWSDKHPEFLDAFRKAKQFSQEWWESVGQTHLIEVKDGEKINAGLYAKSMAARFPDDWREKTETKHTGAVATGPIPSTPEDAKILERFYANYTQGDKDV